MVIARRGITFQPQSSFGNLFAFGTFFLGLGAGLFVLSTFYGFHWGKAAGFIFVLLDFAFLALEAGHPTRVWRAFSRLNTAWISRGVIGLSLFFVLGILAILQSFGLLTWTDSSAAGWTVNVIAMVTALFLVTYSAMVLAGYPAIPAWNTGLLPLLFIFYAFISGTAGLYVMHPLTNIAVVELAQLGVVFVAFTLILILIYWAWMSSAGRTTKESSRLLMRGSLWPHFVVGTVIIGLLVPLAITVLVWVALGVTITPLILAGVAMLIGSFTFRYSLLKAGLYTIPI